MKALGDFVRDFLAERPDNVILEPGQVTAQAVNALRFLAGYALLEEHRIRLDADPLAHAGVIDASSLITYSEWALIRSLFLLYIERETAHYIEATRGFGVDVFGRSSSEVQQDITQMEMEFPRRAFNYDVLTVGGGA